MRACGADTLAPFVLRSDKAYFFGEDAHAFLAYRVVHGVAIVSGDPIGAEHSRRPRRRLRRTRPRARLAHRRPRRIGGPARPLPAHGLHALYHGDEAIVDTSSFSLDGRPIRKVRQSVHRLAAAGYSARLLRPGELDSELRAELETIARHWRGDEPERGFVMALDALFSLDDDDALFASDSTPTASRRGSCTSRRGGGRSLSLSSMPRRAGRRTASTSG